MPHEENSSKSAPVAGRPEATSDSATGLTRIRSALAGATPGDDTRADLSGADLRGADLRAITLDSVDLSGARLAGANLSGAWLRRCILSGADLSGANLESAELEFVQAPLLLAAGLRAASGTLRHVDLRDADLTDADFGGARLSSCTLEGVAFDGANLADSALVDSSCDRASLVGALLTGAETVGTSFREADLAAARDFLACREIVVEVLWRAVDRADPEAVGLVGSALLNRHWCYAEWKEYLSTPDRQQYLQIALDIFDKYPKSGAGQALSAGVDWRATDRPADSGGG